MSLAKFFTTWNRDINVDLELQVAGYIIPTVRNPRISGVHTGQHAFSHHTKARVALYKTETTC